MKIDVSTDRPIAPAPTRAVRDRASTGSAPPSPVPRGDDAHAGASTREVDARELEAAIEAANRSMQQTATNVQFQKDSDTGKTVVRVIDSDTKQVLRQMPSEEMLSISRSLDRLQGLMVHLKA